MQPEEVTTLRLYNPEHVIVKKIAKKEDIIKKQEVNRQATNDQAAQRAMKELVWVIYIDNIRFCNSLMC